MYPGGHPLHAPWGRLLVGGHRCCLHPPLGGPSSLRWVWREETSTQPQPCNTSQVFSLSVPFINNSKPGFDDSLRLVIAPAIKAQQNGQRSPSNLTVTPESRKAQIKPGNIPSCSAFTNLCATPLQQAAGVPPPAPHSLFSPMGQRGS